MPKFHGRPDEDLESLLSKFDVCAKGHLWSEMEKFTVSKYTLHGNAATFMRAYMTAPPDQFMQQLKARFDSEPYTSSNLAQLWNYQVKPDDPISVVKMSVEHLAEGAHPQDVDSSMFQQFLTYSFLATLNDRKLAHDVYL